MFPAPLDQKLNTKSLMFKCVEKKKKRGKKSVLCPTKPIKLGHLLHCCCSARKGVLQERKYCMHSCSVRIFDTTTTTCFASWHLFTDVKSGKDVTWLLKQEHIFHLATCSQ